MLANFEPRLDILAESQLRLWPELDAVPSDFILYGGTGLALQIGHRFSEDFDFFSSSGFDPARLRSKLPFLRDLDPSCNVSSPPKKATLNQASTVNEGFEVVLLVMHPGVWVKRVENPRRAAGSRVRVASLVDLAGMKMRVIQVRGSWKDYVDIHALASHGIDLATGLAAAKAIDRSFDPATSIRALQFYGDGTLDRVPEGMRRDLTRWAQQVDPGKLPTMRPQRGLSPGGMEL